MQVGGMNIQTTAWVTTDFSGGQPKIKEIVKIPQMAAPFLPPQFAGKQYMANGSYSYELTSFQLEAYEF